MSTAEVVRAVQATPAPQEEAPAPQERRRPVTFMRECLLNLTAVGGAVCILLLVLAVAMDVTLILFKTGSMSPTIPAGSLAVVREIPAAQITPGDVVTVDRPGKLPVTHRVTSVSGSGDASRTITMKGDANAFEDPAPYTVESVRRVLWSAPDLAPAIVRMSSPPALAAVTMAVAGLVTWGFWPAADAGNSARKRKDGEPGVRTHEQA